MNSCTRCGKSFSNKWNLQRHVKQLHPINVHHTELKSVAHGIFSKRGQRGDGSPHRVNLMGAGPHGDQTDEESVEDQPLPNVRSRKSRDEESGEDEIWRPAKRMKIDELDRSEEEEDDASLVNSSSDDLDDCESSSGHSMDGEISEGGDDVTKDGDITKNGEAPDENGADEQEARGCVDETAERKMYSSWARWRDSEGGLYVPWKTRKMKSFVAQHRDWMKKFLIPPYEWKQQIMEASESQLDALREMADNVVSGQVAMHRHGLKTMFTYRSSIRAIADGDLSYKNLRHTLMHHRKTVIPLLLFDALPTCIKSHKAVFHDDSE